MTTGSVMLVGSMPSTSAKTEPTSVAWSAFAMTATGEPAPPGKWAESTFSPSIDGFAITSIQSFGEDGNGEVYIVTASGVFKIVPRP